MAYVFIKPFGTAGDRAAIPTDTQVSGSVSYESGWTLDYQKPLGSDPTAKAIPRAQSNQLYYDITVALQQYQTNGVPDFITTSDNEGTPYPYGIYARVRYDDGSGPKVYESMVTANIALPSDATKWSLISGGNDGSPPGMFGMFGGTTAPAGWLVRDGSAISRTTYARLFAAIGTTWGAGNGSTTFNLPNSSRRTTVGAGGTATGILGNIVGSYGGSETHTQTEAEMPTHVHGPLGAGDTHFVCSHDGAGGVSFPDGFNYPGRPTTGPAGGGDPFTIMQPSEVALPCIKY